MKRRQLRNIFFGINETSLHKRYNGNGSLIETFQSRNSKELVEVDLEEALKREVLNKYKPGVKSLPAKIVYVLPCKDPLDMGRFIVIDTKTQTIEQNYPIDKVEDIGKQMEGILENLYPVGLAVDEKTWIEIYTTKDPVLSNQLQHRGKPLMEIVKETVQYSDTDEKRYLNKAFYEFGKGMRILK
ncbi:hypothetical protein CL621_03435 [archaeon]|nr:hypothetical protein [archaeon]|tara:strand:- start:727 stop:1281 length:555 start_codon:yes stop_codon:yes gene_type:complete